MKQMKRVKLGVVLAIIIAIISSVMIFVNADNSNSYVVRVINAQEDSKSNDENIQIQKSIKKNTTEPYYDEKELIYKVDVTNVNESKDIEIALIVDTSYSMDTNDSENLMKAKAIELVKKIYSNCPRAKIKLYNGAGAKTSSFAQYTTANQNTIINAINSLNTGDGNDIANAINIAKSDLDTFSNVYKNIIIFTDATDNTKAAINQAKSADVGMISILMNNIISNSYVENNEITAGKVEMIYNSDVTDEEKLYEEFNTTTITNILNNALTNVGVTDTFSYPLNQYFDFELVTAIDEEHFTKTETGYEWKIDTIKAGETKTLEYKLTIKDVVRITDPQYIGHNIVTSDKVEAKYNLETTKPEEKKENEVLALDKDYIPVIMISGKYSVIIKAVSEESDALGIEGINFDVKVTDTAGNVLVNDTLKTNSNGEIEIENLRTCENEEMGYETLHFELIPHVAVIGYSATDTAEFDITSYYGTKLEVDTEEWKDRANVNDTKRTVNINFPINTKKFQLDVKLTQVNNSDVAIGNTEFRLIQPKLNNKYEMQAKYTETSSDGIAKFYPSVMTKEGTYEYILSQMTVQDGFISTGNVTIRITFNSDGTIKENGVKTVYNETASGERLTASYALVNVGNYSQTEDTFNLELQLTDVDDSRIKLGGSEYDIEVTRTDPTSSTGETTITYHNRIVQDDGKLLIDLPGSGNITIKLTQVKAKTGYNIDSESKVIVINRTNGQVQQVLSALNKTTLTTMDPLPQAIPSENKLLVKLTNTIKSERNIVNVKLTDIEEDINVPNVNLELKNNFTGKTYTAMTGIDGIASFQIDEEPAGYTPYTIKVLSGLPSYYNAMPNTEISLNFSSDGYITNLSNATSTDTVYDESQENKENGTFFDHTYNVSLGATVNEANSYYLEVNLKDAENSSIALEGASYNIQITAESAGGTVTRNITGRKTDTSGKILTKLIMGTNITIEITETDTITGYKLEGSTKTIELMYDTVHGLRYADASTSDSTVGFSGNKVIYNHKNFKKSADDVLLDFTIVKVDTYDWPSGGQTLRIYQEDVGDNYVSTTQGYTAVDGTRYGTWIEEGSYIDNNGNEIQSVTPLSASNALDIKVRTDNDGTVALKGLKVNGCTMDRDSLFYIYVAEVDNVTGLDIEDTIVKFKFTYRYNENKGIIEITNVEAPVRPRLVKEKTYSGYEASIGYQSNVITTLYTNFDDVGGLTLDLRKVNTDEEVLYGAEYTVNILRPDGSKQSKSVVVKEDGTAEVPGAIVTEGTQIELIETKAPIGYEINKETEVLEVTKINDIGEITLVAQPNGYSPSRMKLTLEDTGITSAGTMKTTYSATLTDYELDQFNIKIKAIDADTNKPIEGYSFKIESSKGAQKITSRTGAKGIAKTKVGGYYDDTQSPITYTISSSQVAQYYKDFTAFTTNVNFTSSMIVDSATLTDTNIQTDPNYGTTWKITAINGVEKSDKYDIEIEVYIKQEDPLEVEIETIDGVSGNTVTCASYKVEPSVGTTYTGIGNLDSTTNTVLAKVGYVEKDGSKEYTLSTTVPDNYEEVANQKFTLLYDSDGNITDIPNKDFSPKTTISIDPTNSKKVKIKNVIEPKQGIQIINKDYFTNANIPDAKFEITTQKGETKVADLGALGETSILGDKNGENGDEVTYKVHQTAKSNGYATVPNFDIKVIYGSNREIVDVQLLTSEVSKWVKVNKIIPSTSGDLGYNGNNKGIVTIEVDSYYDFRVNIENVDRINNTKKINGTKYEVTSSIEKQGSTTTGEDGTGIGIVHLDELKLDSTTIVYTIKEVRYSADYQKLEQIPIQVSVKFDSDGYVDMSDPDAVQIISGYGDKYATASKVTATGDNLEKFSVNVQITSNPKFRMNITNVDYNNSANLLSGTKYSITSELGNIIDEDTNRETGADGNGKVTLRVEGNTNTTIPVIYTIHEEHASAGYQRLEEDVKIEVTFNANGTVNSCKVIQGNKFTTASTLTTIITTFDNFAINVEIRSVELLKIKLNTTCEKTDNETRTTVGPVAGAKYSITAIEKSTNENLDVDNNGQTVLDSTLGAGTTIITMDRALSNKTIKYIISEETPATGYKRLDSEIVIEVSFDNDGKIINNTANGIVPVIVVNEDGKIATNFAKISVENDFTINVDIRSNELLDFVISGIYKTMTKINSSETPIIDDNGATVDLVEGNKYIKNGIEYELVKDDDGDLCKKFALNSSSGFTYKISAKEINPTEKELNVDKEGSTNSNGQTRISMDRALANTTIQYTITETKKAVGFNWVDTNIVIQVSFDSKGNIIKNSWSIIGNDANKISRISKVDIYENEINLEIESDPIKEFGIHLRAENMYSGEAIDGVVANAFLKDTTSTSYVTDGKYDYEVINANETYSKEQYKFLYTGADRNGDGYADVAAGEDYLSMGEYKEENTSQYNNRTLRIVLKDVPEPYQWYSNNAGTTQEFAIIINLRFSDEGKIISANLQEGENSYVGWQADRRYVNVEASGYGLNVTLKFYPLLYVKMEAKDMYTNKTLESTLNFSTYSYPVMHWSEADYIHEGYIGDSIANGSIYSSKSSHNYVRTAKTEALESNKNPSGTRIFYIYEEAEPNASSAYYQRYRPKHYTYYHNSLIAKVKVEYNTDGTIKQAEVIEWNSQNNIKQNYIKLKWEGYYLDVDVLYAPTTKVEVTVVDRATNSPLSNIKISPFNNGWERYQYSTIGYETTSSQGKASWTYWGANEAGTTANTIILKTAFNGNAYDGYYLPGDVKIDVAYGQDGRISGATVTSNNLFGDAKNAEIDATCFGDTTLKVTIKLDRKFNLKINKEDIFDKTTKLTAKFGIKSDHNESVDKFSSSSEYITVGRVHAGETVAYTLSELETLDGYLTLPNLRFYVDFSDDGTVIRSYTEKGYEKYFEQEKLGTLDNGIKAPRSTDLTIGIKNVPAIKFNVTLSDAFYNNYKLADGTFKIYNDQGDNASGSLVTNSNGAFSTNVGQIYAGEAGGYTNVEYTIEQTNTVNGYETNNTVMKFVVIYNENGKIHDYYVTQGTGVIEIKPNIYKGTRSIDISIFNIPKYVNIGITKTDATTNEGINDVTFNVTKEDITRGITSTKSYTTQNNASGNGTIASQLDDVETYVDLRTVKYTISEITVPNSYRKIEDVVFNVIYNEDGSIRYYETISNPSNVGLTVYVKGKNITTLNGVATAIKLTIPNDNRYDIVIKDEDINYPGYGVEGTKYDVSIDGVAYSPALTNNSGKTRISDIEGTGAITIKIAENKVGTGYRDNNQNEATILINKGEGIYSLELDPSTNGYLDKANATTTNAIINVDEEHGVITVTFKNETKLELDVGKSDSSTNAALSNVVFDITAQEVDNYGNLIGDVTQITTLGEDDTTDARGKLHFDLGITPQNKTILYTFTETTELDGYYPLEPIEVKAKFDMYGQLESTEDNSYLAYTASNSTNKNGIVVLIDNERIPEGAETEIVNPAYKIKVATADSETNKRINDSIVDIVATKSDGSEIIGSQEGALTGNIEKNGYVIEKGVVALTGLTADGDIDIHVDETEPAIGYEFSNKTSGTVKVHVEYVNNPNSNINNIRFEILDYDGFDVSDVIIDETNHEITVIIKNDPVVTLNINKTYDTYEVKNTEGKNVISKVTKPLSGVKFTITSEIQTTDSIITTSLNKTTKSTDENGKVTVGIGKPYAGKTVLYTLKEEVPEGFEEIDDIVLLIKYDTSGNIKASEILSDEDVTQISEETNSEKENSKEISIDVKNTEQAHRTSYKVILEKHSIEDGEYDYTIPNTEYEITVTEEYGVSRTWTDITDENGQIVSADFSGYGKITVTYTELTAAEGYERDSKTHELQFIIDKNTGLRTEITSDEGYNLYGNYEGKEEVFVLPQDKLQIDRYNFMINKIDASNNKRITDSSAKFELSLLEKQIVITQESDEDGNLVDSEEEVTVETPMGTIITDASGKATLKAEQMPEEEGTYQIKIVETKTPDGYEANEDGYYLNVTFKKNESDTMEIEKVESITEDYIDILKTDKQIIAINLKNKRATEGMLDSEFELDVTKIDSETKEPIKTNETIFKLTDEKGEKSYIETNAFDGKLEIPYFKLPIESEFTENTLTKIYTLEEIRASEGYLVDNSPIKVEITFEKDKDNNVTIQGAKVTKESEEETKTIDSTIENRTISFNVENTEGELINNADRGTYTINLTKIDNDTLEPITGHATFVVTLENGQKVTASTDENGNMQIKDIKVPATVVENVGPYSYVIEETKAAPGYELVTGYTIMELTFKELIDPQTGKGTGLYGIDDEDIIPVIVAQPDTQVASIDNYDKDQVHLIIGNTKAETIIHYEDNVEDEEITVPEDQYKIIGTDINLDEYIPTRTGYNFIEWNTKPDGTGTSYQPGNLLTTDENIDLYAIWELQEFEIRYHKNPDDDDTIVVPENQTKTYGTPEVLDDTITIEREGYNFKGWSIDSNATSTTTPDYQPGDTYEANADIDLYAIWELQEFKITYNANTIDETAVIPADQTKIYGTSEILDNTTAIERTGYIFDGWNTEPDGIGTSYQPGDTYSDNADVTLYAMWTEKLYLRSEEYKIVNAEESEKKSGRNKIYGISYSTTNSSEYNDGDKFIIGIRPEWSSTRVTAKKKGTTITELLSNLETNADNIEITQLAWDSSNVNIVEETISESNYNDKKVATKMKLKLTKGSSQSIELTLIVAGDISGGIRYTNDSGETIFVTGDGKLSPDDISYICLTDGLFKGNSKCIRTSGIEMMMAVDVGFNGSLTSTNGQMFYGDIEVEEDYGPYTKANVDKTYSYGFIQYLKELGGWDSI